jgi:putative ABC transport system permease protein
MGRRLNFDPQDNQALWVFNSQAQYIETQKTFGGINIFVTIVGILTLIAGIVGVSNIMLVSVKERTREIGIRKAIGAPPASILTSIILESIIITAIFGYIGMFLGIGVTEIMNFIMEQAANVAQNADGGPQMSIFKNPTVNIGYAIFATVLLVISGVIAGYLPARKAVKIKPIEAMRQE